MKRMFTLKQSIIEIDGKKVPIDPDFRIMCRYSAAIMRSDKAAAAEAAGAFYFAGLPGGISAEKAAKEMQNFYVSGLAPGKQEEKGEKEKAAEKPKKTVTPCFNFEEDEGYFYAAFLGEYGINLNTVKELHWFDFCALFVGLPDECKLKRIISIRSQSLSDEKTTAGKARLSRLKRIFGLRLAKEQHYSNVAERNKAFKAKLIRQHNEAVKKVKGGI